MKVSGGEMHVDLGSLLQSFTPRGLWREQLPFVLAPPRFIQSHQLPVSRDMGKAGSSAESVQSAACRISQRLGLTLNEA
jgi:hypothetical protein